MQINNDQTSKSALITCVMDYYATRGRFCSPVGAEFSENERYSYDFLIDRKNVIRIHIPIDRRNLYAGVMIGIGPCFVNPVDLMSYADADKFSLNSTTEAIEHNLALLDKYFESKFSENPPAIASNMSQQNTSKY